MKEIAYISRPQGLVFDDDVLAIVRVSRERNANEGVTGVLLYDGDAFLQVIEGEDAVIDRLYATICDDPRHTDVQTVAEGKIAEARFPDWTMAYRRIDDVMDELGPMSRPRKDGLFGSELFLLSQSA